MVTIMTLMGLGRDGRIEQCLVLSRCSKHMRTSSHSSVGMMENNGILKSSTFPDRPGAELGSVGLAWNIPTTGSTLV